MNWVIRWDERECVPFPGLWKGVPDLLRDGWFVMDGNAQVFSKEAFDAVVFSVIDLSTLSRFRS